MEQRKPNFKVRKETDSERKRLEKEAQLAGELEAAELLQDLSTQLIQADNVEVLYDKIMTTALTILRSDFASIQTYDPDYGDEGGLYLFRHRGFKEDDVMFLEWVTPASRTFCSMVMKTCERVSVSDIRKCGFMADSDDLETYLNADIYAIQSTPLLSRNGSLLGVLSTHWSKPHELTARESRSLDVLARQASDLIERKTAEEALRESEKRHRLLSKELQEADCRKDEFLGMLSHEIRNPLTSIMMCLSLLESAEPGGGKAGQAMEIMNRQAKHLSRMVDDLLDVTRITRNKIVLKKEQIELNELVRHSMEVYRPMFQEKGIELTLEPSASELNVEGDSARISQMLGNLLHNSVKFTGSDGSVRVTVSYDKLHNYAVIDIADSGIGMSPEMLKKIFEPFIQKDTSLVRSDGGLGLGLALVNGLVKLHDGLVSAYSEGPGKGSVFTLRLPIVYETTDSKNEPESVDSFCKRRILVIEDIADLAEILKVVLEQEGHEVLVAHNGEKGIEMAKEHCPDILLCDIGLPGINGYEVASTFSKDENLKNVYLVSLTGYVRPEDQKKAKEAGFHHQLAKPVQLEELKHVLEQSL